MIHQTQLLDSSKQELKKWICTKFLRLKQFVNYDLFLMSFLSAGVGCAKI